MTLILNWEDYKVEHGHVSLLGYLELNSVSIRNKYLKFIYGLGEIEFKGKKIFEHFEISKGYNLWWMSLIVEKSLYKSPYITDCLKIIAIEEIIKSDKPGKIILLKGNLACNKILYKYFNREQIIFETKFTKKPDISVKSLVKTLFYYLPYFV